MCRYCDPYLCFHSVLLSAVELLDTKMLLYPFEKQFDLPTAPMQLGDGQRRQGEVVGQEDQSLAESD